MSLKYSQYSSFGDSFTDELVAGLEKLLTPEEAVESW